MTAVDTGIPPICFEMATGHALSLCADVEFSIDQRDSYTLRRKIIQPATEAVGTFFIPDGFWPAPQFLPQPNRHENPEHEFEWHYDDAHCAIWNAYSGPDRMSVLRGRIAMFHSHTGSTPPSDADLVGAGLFWEAMQDHGYWRPAEEHYVLALENDRWYAYDHEQYRRI